MAPKVESVTDSCQLGEGPHWDAKTQSLYFVDVADQSIHKYVPSKKKHTKARIGKKVSIIIPVNEKDDQFVIAVENEIILITWDGESENVSILEKLYEADAGTTFNDGKCDPSGTLWAGTIPSGMEEVSEGKGKLFNFRNKQMTTHLTKIGLSNGLAFDYTLKRFYFIDSYKNTLDQYDFDIIKRRISNGKAIYTLNEKPGFESKNGLDGMTIDTEGNLWVAVFNESRVIKVDPRNPGTIAETVHFPAKQITSVAFGGPNLDELYVTSGKCAVFGEMPSSPEDGRTFRVTGLNAKGFPGVSVTL